MVIDHDALVYQTVYSVVPNNTSVYRYMFLIGETYFCRNGAS